MAHAIDQLVVRERITRGENVREFRLPAPPGCSR